MQFSRVFSFECSHLVVNGYALVDSCPMSHLLGEIDSRMCDYDDAMSSVARPTHSRIKLFIYSLDGISYPALRPLLHLPGRCTHRSWKGFLTIEILRLLRFSVRRSQSMFPQKEHRGFLQGPQALVLTNVPHDRQKIVWQYEQHRTVGVTMVK